MPSRIAKKLKEFYTGNTARDKHRIAWTISLFLIVFLIGFFIFTWFNIRYEEESNEKIQETVIKYHYYLNAKDYEMARKMLVSGKANDAYIKNLEAKILGTNTKIIQLRKAYPALVHQGIATVAFMTDITNEYRNNLNTFSELTIKFMAKEDGKWKIANPVNLARYDKDLLESMIDEYCKYLKPFVKDDKLIQSAADASAKDLDTKNK